MNFLPIGEVIKSRRDDLGYSQRCLARICGVSHVTICNVENGELPRIKTLEAIMQPLGIFDFSISDGKLVACQRPAHVRRCD